MLGSNHSIYESERIEQRFDHLFLQEKVDETTIISHSRENKLYIKLRLGDFHFIQVLTILLLAI